MKLGEVVEEGSSENVFLDPKTDYTRHLLEVLPKII